jgi:chemotaxis protein MotB
MSGLPEEPKRGAPAYIMSFGDMMTNMLTFFILPVTLASTQEAGLLADGIGSFNVAIESHGLDGVLSDEEEAQIFENVRRRFNLPPEEDQERRELHVDASSFELIRATALRALEPHDELAQPLIAAFEPGSAELTADGRAYIDRLADSLRPRARQVLLLEGHAAPEERASAADVRTLAFERARAVERYLLERHGFADRRVESRAWLREVERNGAGTRAVDARLVTPARSGPKRK